MFNILSTSEVSLSFSLIKLTPTNRTRRGAVHYQGVFDHSVGPSLVAFWDVGLVAIGTVETARHIVAIVTQHPEDHLTHKTD